MTDRQETIADIIAEMKREAAQIFPALPIAVLKLATRIEAAWKRERELSVAFQTGRFPERVVSWVYNSNTPRQHRDAAYFGVTPNFDGMGEYKNPTDKRIAQRILEGKKAKGYDWIYCDQVKNVSKGANAHPCEMPLAVMLYIVGSLPADATIIDPFAGSGTTLLAAKRLGRDFVGVEISERYHSLATARLANDSPLFD